MRCRIISYFKYDKWTKYTQSNNILDWYIFIRNLPKSEKYGQRYHQSEKRNGVSTHVQIVHNRSELKWKKKNERKMKYLKNYVNQSEKSYNNNLKRGNVFIVGVYTWWCIQFPFILNVPLCAVVVAVAFLVEKLFHCEWTRFHVWMGKFESVFVGRNFKNERKNYFRCCLVFTTLDKHITKFW